MNKIGDALHIGGNKEEQKHGEAQKHDQQLKPGGEPHKKQGEQKEGFLEKIKDKVSGEGGANKEGGEKKKKKEKKKKGDGKDHGSSSSSDSD